jgi:hypothetical protein
MQGVHLGGFGAQGELRRPERIGRPSLLEGRPVVEPADRGETRRLPHLASPDVSVALWSDEDFFTLPLFLTLAPYSCSVLLLPTLAPSEPGEVGHRNVASDHAPWPEGRALLKADGTDSERSRLSHRRRRDEIGRAARTTHAAGPTASTIHSAPDRPNGGTSNTT